MNGGPTLWTSDHYLTLDSEAADERPVDEDGQIEALGQVAPAEHETDIDF